MGFFSWKTSDTKRSICNVYSKRIPFTVYMVTKDRKIFKEDSYQGYGVFGGADVFVLIARLNGCKLKDNEQARDWAFNHIYKPDYGTFSQLNKRGINVPKFVEKLPDNWQDMPIKKWESWWNSLSFPRDCAYQGFFYP